MKKFKYIDSYLLAFSPELIDYKSVTESEIIKNVVNSCSIKFIQITIEEGKEVLAMEPFPWEWLCNMRGYYSCDTRTFKMIEDQGFYYDWLAKVLAMLEDEAKKHGKL